MNIQDKNLYYIGGIVRDEIMGISNIDVDLTYEGNALEFSKKFNVIKVNPDFGTVRILYEGKEVDIASTRTETYPKRGHLPKVDKIGCPLSEDLKRRDFSINAIAKRTTDGEIIDYFDGLGDIKNNKLKVLHDESFIDDPTRILRGLKFSVRFGFELDEHTQILQEQYLSNEVFTTLTLIIGAVILLPFALIEIFYYGLPKVETWETGPSVIYLVIGATLLAYWFWNKALERVSASVSGLYLNALPLMIRIAKKTKRIVVENIWFSIGVKIIILFLAILFNMPFMEGLKLPMWVAIFGDVGVLIIAVFNAIRALFIKNKKQGR